MKKYFNLPAQCDVCGDAITREFVDGATRAGPWACMCTRCYCRIGRGLGTGLGQLYKRDDSGEFIKQKSAT